ncbi:MAG: hypothetical protein HY360_21875 [Verrucomicrobia bacterium]|nr:hypothetical protein [Verrucomicrobiota bacterium]
MMRRHWRKAVWLLLWMALGAGTLAAMKRADQAFLSYMETGGLSGSAIYELLPADVRFFAHIHQAREEWKAFRQSGLFSALRNVPATRAIFDEWGLVEGEWSAFERWILQFWGPEIIIAGSEKTQAIYIFSPLGNRGQCADWLLQMAASPFGFRVKWRPGQLEGRWCLETDGASFLPPGFHAQFYPIHGAAALAISRRPNPMLELCRLANDPADGLLHAPRFPDFLHEQLGQSKRAFGFIRSSQDNHSEDLGLEWNLAAEKNGDAVLDARLPMLAGVPNPSREPSPPILKRLRQSDDVISMTTSWENLETGWSEWLQRTPPAWNEALKNIGRNATTEIFKEIWSPVFDKLGRHVFIGLGDSVLISERHRLPFPRTVLAFPLEDKDVFVRTIEATVLKCNREWTAGLLIRKITCPNGPYYEVRQADSLWKRKLELKNLPAFAFVSGLLVVSTGGDSMEKILQQMASAPAVPGELNEDGINLWIDLKRAPQIAAFPLVAIGLFHAEDKNESIPSRKLNFPQEWTPILERFGEARLRVTFGSGEARFHVALPP